MNELLVLLKPDAVRKGVCRPIIGLLREQGVQINEVRAGTPSKGLVLQHYAHVAAYGPGVLERNVAFLCSGVVLMLVVEADIPALRKLIGATDPTKAAADTLRAKFSTDSIARAEQENRGVHNIIHASDSKETAAKELNLWRSQFQVKVTEQAIEILQKTRDGEDLAPQDLYLLQEAINGHLTPAGKEAFQLLYVDVCADDKSNYKKPWLAGVENVTVDLRGNVFWKEVMVEHFSLGILKPAQIRDAALSVARDCAHLESIGVAVNSRNLFNEWLGDMTEATPDEQKQMMLRFRDIYEHPDGRIALELPSEAGQKTRFAIIEGENATIHDFDSCSGAYHAIIDQGFHLADCGQKAGQGTACAKAADVLR
jgi:nucleoside-diphosphate kinase